MKRLAWWVPAMAFASLPIAGSTVILGWLPPSAIWISAVTVCCLLAAVHRWLPEPRDRSEDLSPWREPILVQSVRMETGEQGYGVLIMEVTRGTSTAAATLRFREVAGLHFAPWRMPLQIELRGRRHTDRDGKQWWRVSDRSSEAMWFACQAFEVVLQPTQAR